MRMKQTADGAVTIKRAFICWMYRHQARSNGSGAAAGCCASSRLHGGSLRWSGGTCGPCPGRGSSFLRRSGRASLCACAQPLWSIGCLGCVWRPCGRDRPESPRRTCRWSPRPPSRSWAPSGLRSDGQHAPGNNTRVSDDALWWPKHSGRLNSLLLICYYIYNSQEPEPYTLLQMMEEMEMCCVWKALYSNCKALRMNTPIQLIQSLSGNMSGKYLQVVPCVTAGNSHFCT